MKNTMILVKIFFVIFITSIVNFFGVDEDGCCGDCCKCLNGSENSSPEKIDYSKAENFVDKDWYNSKKDKGDFVLLLFNKVKKDKVTFISRYKNNKLSCSVGNCMFNWFVFLDASLYNLITSFEYKNFYFISVKKGDKSDYQILKFVLFCNVSDVVFSKEIYSNTSGVLWVLEVYKCFIG